MEKQIAGALESLTEPELFNFYLQSFPKDFELFVQQNNIKSPKKLLSDIEHTTMVFFDTFPPENCENLNQLLKTLQTQYKDQESDVVPANPTEVSGETSGPHSLGNYYHTFLI